MMKMTGVEGIGVGFCPASLCRLLRGIASGAPGQGRAPQPTTAPPHSSHSFTIAAILGLKGHEGYEDIPSATQSQGVPGNSRGRPRNVPGHQQNHSSQSQNNNNNNNTSTHHHHHGSKSKRVRTIFTPEQLERLEAEFERQQYMVGPERLYLAHALQLTEAQVKVWFQNRRIKWRKQHLELTQQRLAMVRRQQLAEQAGGIGQGGEDGGDTSSSAGDLS